MGTIEAKVQAAGFWSLISGFAIAILNAVQANSALLGALPPLAQFAVITLAPGLLVVLSAYRAAHTPRPDLYNYGPALEGHLPEPPPPLEAPAPPVVKPQAQPEPPLLSGYIEEPRHAPDPYLSDPYLSDPYASDPGFGRGDTTAYGWDPQPQVQPQPTYSPQVPRGFVTAPPPAPPQGRHAAPQARPSAAPQQGQPHPERRAQWADPRAATAPRPPQR